MRTLFTARRGGSLATRLVYPTAVDLLPVEYSTLPEGMKFTQVVFSCKQYGDYTWESCCTVHSAGTASTEPGNGTGLREIDVHCQRSSVPSKSAPKWQCLLGV